jgi:branched-chain amino acid transport system substrate-binding protein
MAAGCGGDDETTTTAAPTETTGGAATGEPFQIGINAPYTGINAGAWPGTYNGLKLEIARVNAAGGVNGRQLEMVELDTKSDPTTAANNATNLCTNDDIDACFMTYPPEEIAAIAPIVEKYGMPSVTAASPLDMQAELYQGEWLFYVMASGENYTQAILEEIKAQGWTSVLGIADQILLDIEILDKLEVAGPAEGIAVTVMADQVSLAETDLTPYCNKIYAEWKKNPTDAVLLMDAMTQFPQLYKGLRGLGLDVPIVGGPVCAHVASFAMGPEAVEGAIIVGNAATNVPGLPDDYPNKAMMLEYNDACMAEYQAPLDMWGAQAVDAIRVICEGLKVGGDDRQATRDAMEALKDFPSAQGTSLTYMPGNHTGISGGWVTWEMTNGEFKFVRALN